MFQNFLWSFIPNELKLPHPTYHYFISAQKYPFDSEASEFSLANAAWLTDLTFLAYADKNFITAQLHKVGLIGEPHFIGFDQALESTQCVIVHNAEIIVVIFRGTEFHPKRILNAMLDTSVDMHAVMTKTPELGGFIHKGFLEKAQAIYSDIVNALAKIRTTQTIWFTGHSMGGALAILAAKLYAVRKQQSVNGIYTIGCPHVGDETFTTLYQLPLFCLINYQDPITRMPEWGKVPHGLLNSKNYAAIGKAIFLNKTGELSYVDTRPSVISNLLQVGFTSGISFVLGMLDHAPLRYSKRIWKHLP